MKKTILAAAGALLAVPALAADLPLRTAAPPPAPASAPIFSWAGLYAGGQIGYGWGETTGRLTRAGVVTGSDLTNTGVLGGLHAGYNWRSGRLVFGAELDFEATGLKGDAPGVEVSNSLRGSARLRAGVLMDQALLYATGGLAQARWKRDLTGRDSIILSRDTELGWTVGAGVEYALSLNWSARAEYRFSDFGDTSIAIPAGFFAVGEPAANLKVSAKDHAIRFGVSYRFNQAAGPLLARY